jgi:hypothetical protein
MYGPRQRDEPQGEDTAQHLEQQGGVGSVQRDQHGISQVQRQAAPEEREGDGDRNLTRSLCPRIEHGAPHANTRRNDTDKGTQDARATEQARTRDNRSVQVAMVVGTPLSHHFHDGRTGTEIIERQQQRKRCDEREEGEAGRTQSINHDPCRDKGGNRGNGKTHGFDPE